MTSEIDRVIRFPRLLLQVVTFLSVAAMLLPSVAIAVQEESIVVLWDRIGKHRTDAEYDRAIELINQIIQEYTNSDEILRRAHNELVNTIQQKEEDWDASEVKEKAREALARFPDLDAEETYFHPDQNRLYDQLRRQMFGLLKISEPKDCRVFLNDELKGVTPVQLDLVKICQCNLTRTKSGYYDKSQTINIGPDDKKDLSLSLDRQRNKRWWFYRVGPAVLAGVALAVGLSLSGDDSSPPEEAEPLPEPPPPPAR